MKIYFPDERPEFVGAPAEVRFTVIVDGQRVPCGVSAEALSDHFEADGPFEQAMLRSFELGRPQIFKVCRAALERNAGQSVLLRSGLFRFARASGHC